MLASSTNYVDYYKFVQLVAGQVPADVDKPFWFFDGHPSHARKASVDFVSRYFKPIQSVPYSCSFNSVEIVWGLFKRLFRKRLMLWPDPLTQTSFNALVNAALDSIPPESIRGALRSNRRYLRQLLQPV